MMRIKSTPLIKSTFKKTAAILFFLFLTGNVLAQTDTLLLSNNNMIVGEVKGMNRGVLTMETDYSDTDFKIEWEKIKRLKTETFFLITLTDGKRYNGTIATADSSLITINTDEGLVTTDINHIVFLKSVDSGFWSQLYASIDLGYSHTKANNFQQYSARSSIGYLAERWSAGINYNNIFSSQDEIDNLHRLDADFTFRYYLQKDWYLMAQVNWLSNTEQELNLRTVSNLGLGKYLIHTNQTYWGIQAGGSFNNEDFYDETSSRQSAEGFFGTELNMYDIGDLNLLTNVIVYPSITEAGRWRVDYSFDTQYDLPLDFYIKIGFSLNYDNQPAEGGSDTDYVVQTTFGWSL